MSVELKFIPDTNNMYMVTNDGRVFSLYKRGWMKHNMVGCGYHQVGIYDKKNYVHRLVADAFVCGKSDDKNEVDHIDRNKLNNHYTNLRWVSHGENSRNKIYNGCKRYRTDCKRKKPWEFRIYLNSNKRITKFFLTEAECDKYAEEMNALREANIQKEIMKSMCQ